MFSRDIKSFIETQLKGYPVLAVTGPRQSGKTTLLRSLFPDRKYINLEDLEMRREAIQDPKMFLSRFPEGAIIDEVQHAPDLFSYIQVRVDENKKMGEFILSGSSNFLLLKQITQSLAGRVALMTLLPFSYDEVRLVNNGSSVFEVLYKGFYPPLYDREVTPYFWYRDYIDTYVERDVRQIANIGNIMPFKKFLKLLAGRVGQLLNMESLASEAGITTNTAKQWLSILQASYIVYNLTPHFVNFNKRLVKQSKVYFYDTGLLCSLLDLKSPEELSQHYLRGSVFENYVISDVIKVRFNLGMPSNIYFWRDHHGKEIDLLFDEGQQFIPCEIKLAQTLQDEYFDGLQFYQKLSEGDKGFLICGKEGVDQYKNFSVIGWRHIKEMVEEIGTR